jgi:hypothetical protein
MILKEIMKNSLTLFQDVSFRREKSVNVDVHNVSSSRGAPHLVDEHAKHYVHIMNIMK